MTISDECWGRTRVDVEHELATARIDLASAIQRADAAEQRAAALREVGDVMMRRLIAQVEPRVRLESWRGQCLGCGETWSEGSPQRHNEACPVLAWHALAASGGAAPAVQAGGE